MWNGHTFLNVANSFKGRLTAGFLLAASVIYYFSLPDLLFNDPCSTVLEDSRGRLLSASIATDGQWRFPESDVVPDKFARALITFEDKRFYAHPGVDLLALGRAMRDNISQGEIVGGGSTLTMQVVRLARKNPPRTIYQKLIEIILATRVEWRYSKQEILSLYASHAPFGGNVVGLEAACWRYFGRPADDLSWAEAAMLAVLPNNPSLIHLARNRAGLLARRNSLLKRLYLEGYLNETDFHLALAEEIPAQPLTLPRIASHLLNRGIEEGHAGKRLKSTINLELQSNTEKILKDYAVRLLGNEIHNAAALIMEVKSGHVLAYAGNVGAGPNHGAQVDMIRARRSTGSILKPFLYAAMLDEGSMLPHSLQPDVPVLINGFAPRNFSRRFEGAVPASQALIRSLNVPAVFELKEFRYEKFHHLLQNMGMSTLQQGPDHYGLTLILGGAEGTLWDITGMFASAARTLNNYFTYPGGYRYRRQDFHPPNWEAEIRPTQDSPPEGSSWLSAGSIHLTFEVLRELNRPGEETGWQHFSSAKPIAWKTGTSFGFRDGWAVGVTPEYAVGVWVGNADGEGRPGLTGTEAAAPLLFNLFGLLPGSSWFDTPGSELIPTVVCRQSGFRAGTWCEQRDTIASLKTGIDSPVCPFHRMIHVTPDRKFRVHADCFPPDRMVQIGWFTLPPLQEHYYQASNLSYRSLPPYKQGCQNPSPDGGMELVYPGVNARMVIPYQLDGQPGAVVLEAVHHDRNAQVFWHLDGQYVGVTSGRHQVTLSLRPGRHLLTLVDDSGETLRRTFEAMVSR